jgi:hypothetical protein
MSHTAVLLREAIDGGLMGEALFWRGSKISGCWEFGSGFASNHVYVQGHVMVGGGGGGGTEMNQYFHTLTARFCQSDVHASKVHFFIQTLYDDSR